jgi:hypothetical protein
LALRRRPIPDFRFPIPDSDTMADLQEKDSMTCRACGNEERASEGYPCDECGTFLCVMCNFRGVTRCKACEEKRAQSGGEPARS